MKHSDPWNALIRPAIDAQFSALQANPGRRNRIMMAAKGEKKVKKKISVGLILALFLALTAVTALAAALTDYFNTFAHLEASLGQYTSWPASAKVELVQAMENSGLSIDGEKAERMKAADSAEKEKLAAEILDLYFADLYYVDIHNIFTKEWGDMNLWTPDQHMLYQELMKKHGWWGEDWPEHFIPGNGDLSEVQAIQRAREALCAKYDVTQTDLDSRTIKASFMNNVLNVPGDEPVWQVEFQDPVQPQFCYRAVMTNTGDMISIAAPNSREIPWGESTLQSSRIAQPQAHDADAYQAIGNARNALTEIAGLSYAEAHGFSPSPQLIYNEFFCHGEEPVWLVIFYGETGPRYKVLLRWNGEYICWASWNREFIREGYPTWVVQKDRYYPHGIMDEKGRDFWDWSFEDQAAFSQEMIPIVDAMVQENPYFIQEYNDLYWATRRTWGIPADPAISQAQAQSLIWNALKAQYNLTDAQANRPLRFAYDITDPQNPLWEARIYMGAGDYNRYAVTLDINSGKIIKLQQFPVGFAIPSKESW